MQPAAHRFLFTGSGYMSDVSYVQVSGTVKVKLSSVLPGMTTTATVTKVCYFCFYTLRFREVIK